MKLDSIEFVPRGKIVKTEEQFPTLDAEVQSKSKKQAPVIQ